MRKRPVVPTREWPWWVVTPAAVAGILLVLAVVVGGSALGFDVVSGVAVLIGPLAVIAVLAPLRRRRPRLAVSAYPLLRGLLDELEPERRQLLSRRRTDVPRESLLAAVDVLEEAHRRWETGWEQGAAEQLARLPALAADWPPGAALTRRVRELGAHGERFGGRRGRRRGRS